MKNIHNRWMAVMAFSLLFCLPAIAQSKLEGYVFEQNNRGYLNQVKIKVTQLSTGTTIAEVESNQEGYFSAQLPPGDYRITAEKDIFFTKTDTVTLGTDKSFVKMELRRRPGYLFDATLAQVRDNPDEPVDAVQGATIEIYNRTAQRSELVIRDDNDAFFQFTFERGNHYTMLIRKEGYLSKRIEVYVNVNGCIICVDGVRDVTPGVSENLTSNNEMGTLLANIELDKAKLDKRIQIQNIYYDYDKWDIRPDAAKRLDNVVTLMQDNPGLSVELGSHTDSRGNDDYNESLSQKRAQAAVAYIVSEGVDSQRISAKGYGEKILVNRCKNGVECNEEEHQKNRRTELRITGIGKEQTWKSLEEIVLEETSGKIIRKEPSKPQSLSTAATKEEIATAPAPASILYEYEGVRILQLPAGFKGCAVELTRSKSREMGADDHAFKGQTLLFHYQEADGSHSYIIANLGSCEKTKDTFNKKIKPLHSTARLVSFGENGKEYLK